MSIDLHTEIAAGPSAPATVDGTLDFTIDSDGMLVDAVLTTENALFTTIGIATGRAIDVQIELSGDELIVLSGRVDIPVVACPSAAAGLVSGPQPGDLGAGRGSTAGTSNSSGSITGTSTPETDGSCP